jgi:chromate reductase, NAD(P)H dehydrogenase (quinone)
VRVLGISGSLRRGSYNTRLLRAVARTLPPAAELELYDAEALWAISPYSEDAEALGEPETVSRLKRAIADADAVLISTPEYNASIPGQLKNALDWVSRPAASTPMRNKPAAVIGASTSLFGAVWAQAEIRKVLGHMGARVIDQELPVARAAEAFDAEGSLHDAEIEAALRELTIELLAEVAPQLAAA